MEAVKSTELRKTFGDIIAVDSLNLHVSPGTIFGLLGPNGAGKSTTIRLLSTLLYPDSGTASVHYFDILEDPVAVRRITGVLPEEGNHTHYDSLSAYENLEYFAKLYDVSKDKIHTRIEELLNFMNLWDRKDDKAGELSTGNRQRLALCRALLHEPKVLLLDEPTSALDPIAAKRVRELILNLSKTYGQTFFINSHNLAEVQRICDQIAIINEGKILISGSTSELRATLQTEQEYRIRIIGDVDYAISIIEAEEFVESVEAEVDTIVAMIKNPIENNSILMKKLLDAGVQIVEFAEEETTLEDLYLQVVTGGDV
ncbi:MAG: hypothetical protein BAJATHORv1_40124 [Candidatus Thorarchaeota archaeon]|nr:MAG: hypothetical protein BAJATHORv1_40124 [Candidatus Thorarchaeota archaeon]